MFTEQHHVTGTKTELGQYSCKQKPSLPWLLRPHSTGAGHADQEITQTAAVRAVWQRMPETDLVFGGGARGQGKPLGG